MTSLQLFQKGTDYLLGLDIERTILGHVTQIYLLVLVAAFYSFAISCQHTIVASTSIFSMQGFFKLLVLQGLCKTYLSDQESLAFQLIKRIMAMWASPRACFI